MQQEMQNGSAMAMMISAIIAGFLIVGLFLAMLSSSPKTNR